MYKPDVLFIFGIRPLQIPTLVKAGLFIGWKLLVYSAIWSVFFELCQSIDQQGNNASTMGLNTGIQIIQYTGSDFSAMVSFDNDFFINATEIYQAAGKPQSTFDSFKNRTLIPRAQKLIDMDAIAKPQNEVLDVEAPLSIGDLIISRKGGKEGEAGTWIHPKLRMVFARWISEVNN